MLLDFGVEVQRAILSRLSKVELVNISQCSKRHNTLVQPFIWACKKIPVERLDEPYNRALIALCEDLTLADKNWPLLISKPPPGYTNEKLNEELVLAINAANPNILRLHYGTVISVAKFSLSHMSALSELYLQNRDFEDELVNRILSQCVTSLKALCVKYSSNTDKAFVNIHRFPFLQKLEIVSADITASTLTRVDGSQLKEVNLGECVNFADADMRIISSWKNLEILNLYGYDGSFTMGSGCIGSTGFHDLASLRLKELNVSYHRIRDHFLRYIGSMSDLEKLNLSSSEITDSGLVHLKKLSNLKVLNLDECYFVGEKVPSLSSLPITSLSLRRTGVSDKTLKEFQRFTSLRDLDLQECERVTGTGLKYLVRMESLKKLNVTDTRAGEDGIAISFFAKKRKDIAVRR